MSLPVKASLPLSPVSSYTVWNHRGELMAGGGTGIGLMQTLALAQNGAKVYITSRNADKLNHVAEQYKSSGEIVPVVGDITSKDGIAKIVEQISKESPNGINILYVPPFTLGYYMLMEGSTMLVLPEKDLERDMRSRMMFRNSASNCSRASSRNGMISSGQTLPRTTYVSVLPLHLISSSSSLPFLPIPCTSYNPLHFLPSRLFTLKCRHQLTSSSPPHLSYPSSRKEETTPKITLPK
jgi:hypothetical protein